MRSITVYTSIALLALSMVPLAPAAPAVEVVFKNPEKFSDIQKLGERYLPSGQQLQIEIRNIDLAGRYEPWRPNAYEVRFMRDIT